MVNTLSDPHPYDALTPEVILAAVEQFGISCDGRILALNSYENRVYQIGVHDDTPVVVKFYRPGRWSDEAILEEHAFTQALSDREIPVVAPLPAHNGNTLYSWQGFRFAVYPRRGGHWPELDNEETLMRIGYFIGRIHALGAIRRFHHRPTLSVAHFGYQNQQFLLASEFMPPHCRNRYREVSTQVLELSERVFAHFDDQEFFAIHGDCHPGNILWTESGAHFVDFDDCINGPAVQDLWMLLSGEQDQMRYQLNLVLEGYTAFQPFDRRQLLLIEPLRTLRLIHYSAWLARRWHDPAFPKSFPWFDEPYYWEEQIQTLEEQIVRIERPALETSANFIQ